MCVCIYLRVRMFCELIFSFYHLIFFFVVLIRSFIETALKSNKWKLMLSTFLNILCGAFSLSVSFFQNFICFSIQMNMFFFRWHKPKSKLIKNLAFLFLFHVKTKKKYVQKLKQLNNMRVIIPICLNFKYFGFSLSLSLIECLHIFI